MKRLYIFIILSLVLLTSCNKEEIRPTEIKVQVESVTGSRARFTVATASSRAYYSYVIVKQDDQNYNSPASVICNDKIKEMVSELPYYETGSFTDVFCFRGSRQFNVRLLEDDKDYKFIAFQINPKKYELIGEPVVCNFHTKPVPDRDLHFEVNFEGDVLRITPSDENLTYVWDYEESEMINNIYGYASYYLYRVVEMYLEYGFLDMFYKEDQSIWYFGMEDEMTDGTEYTIAISGCEEGEFTTPVTVVRFRYHPNNIEVLEITEDGNDKLSHPKCADNKEPKPRILVKNGQDQSSRKI